MTALSSSLPAAEVRSEDKEADDRLTASDGGTADGLVVPGRHISSEPLDLAALLGQAHHPRAGAVVLFSGEVRDHNHGRAVSFLEYEAYTALADTMIEEILDAAKVQWGLEIALAVHRVGRVAIGETAVVVITSSPHRAEAYAANQYIIDRIKHEAPIWKCEHFTDGTHQWGNNCNCHPQ